MGCCGSSTQAPPTYVTSVDTREARAEERWTALDEETRSKVRSCIEAAVECTIQAFYISNKHALEKNVEVVLRTTAPVKRFAEDAGESMIKDEEVFRSAWIEMAKRCDPRPVDSVPTAVTLKVVMMEPREDWNMQLYISNVQTARGFYAQGRARNSSSVV
jgi:hypothetical protein